MRMHTPGSRSLLAPAGLIALGVLTLGPASYHAAAERPPPARVGDVTLSLTPLVDGGTITARDPLLLRITVANKTNGAVAVATGNGSGSAFRLSIHTARGETVATSPPLESWGGFGVVHVGARQDRSWVWVATGLCQFAEPGAYTLRLSLEQPLLHLSQGAPAIAEAVAKVQVLAFDAKRVDARCAELVRPHRRDSPLGELDLGCRAKALYSVRHDVALPYLDWMAREHSDPYACRAIQRIGTPRAKALYGALAARTDSVGKAARSVPKLNMPDVAMWDIICD